jgi:methionyl-tRNA synthetase
MITFGEFQKMDIRIGEIINAENVEGTDKLLKLEVELGDEKRTLVAGIGDVYSAENIVGKRIPVRRRL